jgi:RHS repeat-associated protein
METFNSGSCRYRYNALDQLTGLEPVGQATSQRFYRLEHLATEVQGPTSQSVLQHGTQLLALQTREGDDFHSQLLATDQQRSVLRVTDPVGPVQQVYTAYGHRRVDRGLGSLLGFNGEAVVPVTGHYLLGNGHRAFNPVLMRFNSPDKLSPFGRGGLNSYAYCLGNPVSFRDPTGQATEQTWQPWLIVGLAALGLVSAGVGLFSMGLAFKDLKVTSVPASAAASKKAVQAGAVATVAGVVGAGVGMARASINAADPSSSAQDALIIAAVALSVISLAGTISSVGFSLQGHRLNKAAALSAATSEPIVAARRIPRAQLLQVGPSAPPLTPRAVPSTLPPIGFERFRSGQHGTIGPQQALNIRRNHQF